MMQNNKSIKIILLFLVFTLLITWVIVFKLAEKNDTKSHKMRKIYDQFSAKNVLIKSFNGGRLFSIAKADRIIHRDRTTRFYRYHNLKELYFPSLVMEFFLDESNFLSDRSIPHMVKTAMTQDIGSMFIEKDTAQIVNNSDINSMLHKPDYRLITRAVIDNFSIILYFPNNSSVKVSSGNAVINFESKNIEFKKNFSIIDTQNKKIAAPEAVWIYNSNHLFFPKGYILFPFRKNHMACFFLDNSGRLKKSKNSLKQKIKKDTIDEAEEQLAELIAPYLNVLYTSLLTKGKIDSTIFKERIAKSSSFINPPVSKN
jgi:hypothetical protein